MAGVRLGENMEMKEELIKKACHLAFKAHKSPSKPYLCEKSRSSSEAIFGFPGSWSAGDWVSRNGNPFGKTEITASIFPSLRSVGVGDVAVVKEACLRRFEAILSSSPFPIEVDKAVSEKKQVVFSGHSSGGPIAILATLWFLEKYLKPNPKQTSPRCLTFGSPIIGDRIFPHALRRENWDQHFTHFVTKYDIIPRITLAPTSSVDQKINQILLFLNPKSPLFQQESIGKSSNSFDFFMNVARSSSAVSSHVACNLMGCTNPLLETLAGFFELSPYRPFGRYVFCTGNGKLVVVRNSDAVLQMLFYCLQLSSEEEGPEVAYRSLKEHLGYENELDECLGMQNVVFLDDLANLPLSSDGSFTGEAAEMNVALNDLGLSARARLCLRAAGEWEKQKQKNQSNIDYKMNAITEGLDKVQEYQATSELRNIGYYDSFKLQKEELDFKANIKRIELIGIWDEIVEMLKRYELPDGFEARKEWIKIGTRFRRLVEPLDIANYYRHLKNDDTGPYMKNARPKRYRYTQRWRESAERLQSGSSSESCFWAEVEELRVKPFGEIKDDVVKLEQQLNRWVGDEVLGKDVFLGESTFVKWWKLLPYDEHRSKSCIATYIAG